MNYRKYPNGLINQRHPFNSQTIYPLKKFSQQKHYTAAELK